MSSKSPWNPRVVGFLAAETLSSAGSFATVIAVWGYAAYHFDASPGELSIYGLAFAAPGVLFGPIAGQVVDRVGAKETLALAKVLGVVASLAFLATDTFLAMTVLTAVHGIGATFAQPALQSMPPRLVADDQLATTNALVGMTDESSLIFGPALGGAAIALFGFKGAFVVDAITYAIGLLVLPLVHLRPAERQAPSDRSTGVREVFAGWSLIARTPILLRTVTCTAIVFGMYGLAFLAEPLYVRDVLERSPATFAALQVVFGIFLIGGGLVAARLGDRIATFRWVAIGAAGSGIAAILYLGTPWVVVAFGGVAVWGVFTAIISGPSRTVLQRATPEHAHGRVLAADMVAGNGAMFVGTVAAGPLIEAIEVQGAVLLFGLAAFVAGLVALARDQAGVSNPLLTTTSTESVL
jgi:DHA3 family macrolide efflux protein-like MFS transporter